MHSEKWPPGPPTHFSLPLTKGRPGLRQRCPTQLEGTQPGWTPAAPDQDAALCVLGEAHNQLKYMPSNLEFIQKLYFYFACFIKDFGDYQEIRDETVKPK